MFLLNLCRNLSYTVASVITHTLQWTPEAMGYYRVWVVAEVIVGVS